MNVNGSHLHRMHCIGIIHMQWVIFSIFIQFSLPQQTLMPSPILSTQNDKETRENQKQTNLGQWELFCKIWHMYIALLQFYKQMYNKYIINRLLLWDSEEPACVFFFLLFLVCPYGRGMSPDFPLRGVLVLLCTTAAEIHPPHVVPVCYPMVGTQSVASAVCRGVSAHRTWEETYGGDRKSGWRRNRAWGKLVNKKSIRVPKNFTWWSYF